MPGPSESRQRGSASVEQAALTALLALVAVTALAALAAQPEIEAGRGLAAAIGRRLACGPRLPDSCHHHPLVAAYGWPLARLARALAPAPAARLGPSGAALVPVDFRRCRRESCARAASPGLTASGRRTTAFTQLIDRRRSLGWVELIYWLYRPGLGWERVGRRAGMAEIAAASRVRVLVSDVPALVPLEILPGRDHYPFSGVETPPWRATVESRHRGWSS